MSHSDNKYIYLSLLHMGAVGWNKSAKRLMHALQYVTSHGIESESIKCVYTELASALNSNYGAVERSLKKQAAVMPPILVYSSVLSSSPDTFAASTSPSPKM